MLYLQFSFQRLIRLHRGTQWLSRVPRRTRLSAGCSRWTSTVGDRLTDETGEDEVIGRPYTTNIGKSAHVRVKRVDNAEVTMIRTYAAHERRITRGNSYSVILRRIAAISVVMHGRSHVLNEIATRHDVCCHQETTRANRRAKARRDDER
jgi:hypothetical protein